MCLTAVLLVRRFVMLPLMAEILGLLDRIRQLRINCVGQQQYQQPGDHGGTAEHHQRQGAPRVHLYVNIRVKLQKA